MRNSLIVTILSLVILVGCMPFRYKKSYSILEHINILQNMETLHLDTAAFKAHQAARYQFTREDESVVEQSYIESGDYYVEWVDSPTKFYTHYNLYYTNGNIKLKGYFLDDIDIGKWEHYDEHGNVEIEDMDKQFDAFDYNKVILLLHDIGVVDINTGDGKDGISYYFDKEKHQWEVITGYNYSKRLGRDSVYKYIIDSRTGKILQKKHVLVLE